MHFQIKSNSKSQVKMHVRTHVHTHLWATFKAGCYSVRWGMGEKRAKGKKVSRLSITELSECYLCQTPTILSSDTETASRTSGRCGKHSRTPREVWQPHWIQQTLNTEHTCACTHTQTHNVQTWSHNGYTCTFSGTHTETLKRQTQRQALTPSDLQNCHAYTK